MKFKTLSSLCSSLRFTSTIKSFTISSPIIDATTIKLIVDVLASHAELEKLEILGIVYMPMIRM
jgi:hypothetical protein